MSWSMIVAWVPMFRPSTVPRGGVPRGTAPLEARVIADIGLLWCDLAYGEQGVAPALD